MARETERVVVCGVSVLLVWVLAVWGDAAGGEAGGLDPYEGLDGAMGGDAVMEAKRFSNTGRWERALWEESERMPRLLEGWEERVELATPPANGSERTRAEIGYLLGLKEERSDERVRMIRDEQEIGGMEVGGFRWAALEAELPACYQLFLLVMEEATPVLFALKRRFDRPRPHVLERDLVPVIAVPGHPAYPSGHATQAYLMAGLADLLVEGRERRHADDARRVAWHRELAGLHFPSDSEAGRKLAEQVLRLLLERAEFVALVELARAEVEATLPLRP
jgi:hypothetical protein